MTTPPPTPAHGHHREISVDVILPTLNERQAIPVVLASLPGRYRPLVVDNGSTDGSGALAASLGATVVTEPRRGFGAACWAGLNAATADIVCFMDCDGTLNGADLPALVAAVADGSADLVLGRRIAQRGAWPPHARLATRLLAGQVRRRCNLNLRDIGPMRAVARQSLLALGLVDRRFGWPLEMVVRAAEQNWRITELDVTYTRRRGKSKVTGTVRGTLRTVKDMRAVLQ
jgi:glycosyltransferase involved in cell wall biosynthesis